MRQRKRCAAAVAGRGLEVAAHRSIHHAARRLAAAGLAVPLLKRARPGGVLLWPVLQHGKLAAALDGASARVLLVSGLAADPAARAAVGADAAYAWSNAADRAQLLGVIEATGASRVFLTGRCAEDVAQALGPRARVLAPPRQMALFAEAMR